MRVGDKVIRPDDVDQEMYWNTFKLMVNHEYKIIHILDNGLLVLENYLCLVHPDSIHLAKEKKGEEKT